MKKRFTVLLLIAVMCATAFAMSGCSVEVDEEQYKAAIEYYKSKMDEGNIRYDIEGTHMTADSERSYTAIFAVKDNKRSLVVYTDKSTKKEASIYADKTAGMYVKDESTNYEWKFFPVESTSTGVDLNATEAYQLARIILGLPEISDDYIDPDAYGQLVFGYGRYKCDMGRTIIELKFYNNKFTEIYIRYRKSNISPIGFDATIKISYDRAVNPPSGLPR